MSHVSTRLAAGVGALFGAAVLSGCAASVPIEPAQPQPEYSSIGDLYDAFMGAGGECADWRVGESAGDWVGFGTCGNATESASASILTVYDSEATRDSTLEGAQRDDPFRGTDSILVGPFWTIETTDAQALQGELGGIVVLVG